MIEALQNFHFIRPIWLLALPVVILFYYKYFKGIKNKSSWEGVFDKHLLNFLTIKNSNNYRKKIGHIILTGTIASILILSAPTWNKTEKPNIKPENPVMILLNLSSDMLETDVSPNRLTRAKFKISDLLSELETAQIGLIVYNDEPYLVSPITTDINLIENILPNIDETIMPSNGDRLDRALSLAIEKFKDAKYISGNIIIVTSDIGERLDLASEAIKNITNSNYKLNLLNINTKKNEKLSIISNYKNVTSANLSIDDSDIKLISKSINQNIESIKNIAETNSIIWQEYGYFFLFIPLLSCLYLFRKGIMIIIITIVLSSNAYANIFENNNQKTLKIYTQENYEDASKNFTDDKWIGSAHYKNQNYEKALEYFSKSSDEKSKYNHANALAKFGKVDEAIKEYEKILSQNSEHEDAKFNLEYLKQQNQNDPQSSNSNQNNDDKNQEKQEENKDINASSNQNSQEEKSDKNENAKSQNSKKEDMNKEKEEKQEVKTKSSSTNKPEEYKYRNIPDNPGGLLRAFIYKEYKKGRYNND